MLSSVKLTATPTPPKDAKITYWTYGSVGWRFPLMATGTKRA